MVTDTRPRFFSSSTRDSFSESVDGVALRTSLCGENEEAEESIVSFLDTEVTIARTVDTNVC